VIAAGLSALQQIPRHLALRPDISVTRLQAVIVPAGLLVAA
jgi:hypothetical protein